MAAYYNENDPQMAAWLRELIKEGHIAPGDVDERSIEDVKPEDVVGYQQSHFFAGVGVWSFALRKAGWPDDRPVWTGSCPCQPFSSAGKRDGFDDERHLWPAFHWLIEQCRPGVVFGEQVAGTDGEAWLDLVSTDLENSGFAIGPVITAACGFGSPQKRLRIYWVADRQSERREGRGTSETGNGREIESSRFSSPRVLADANSVGRGTRSSEKTARTGNEPGATGASCGMADTNDRDPGSEREFRCGEQRQQSADSRTRRLAHSASHTRAQYEHKSGGGETSEANHSPVGLGANDQSSGPGPVNGFWRAADWLFCRDGKWRPVEPGTFPLADGVTERVGRVRGYGNAIVAPQAQAFIEAYLEVEDLIN